MLMCKIRVCGADEIGMFICFQALKFSLRYVTLLDILCHKCKSESRHLLQLSSDVLFLKPVKKLG